jgi:hypothetical protein
MSVSRLDVLETLLLLEGLDAADLKLLLLLVPPPLLM